MTITHFLHRSAVSVFLSFSVLCVFVSPIFARGYIDVGFEAGAFWVTDPIFRSTFGKDVLFSGKLGFVDTDNNWEVLAKIGHYQATSQHPDDVGNNFKADITPLTASLVYHLGDRDGMIQPYFGVGGDAYFYGLQNDIVGVIDTGSRFGVHWLAGLRFNMTPKAAITVEFSQNYSPKPVFFSSSVDFNSRAITIGLSVNLQPILTKNGTEVGHEDHYQDSLLDEISSVQSEIKKMKDNRDKVEQKIDAFYESDDLESSIGINAALAENIPLVGMGIRVVEPVAGTLLAAGVITTVEPYSDKTRITLKNTDGWMLTLDIASKTLAIGDKINRLFNEKNINSSVTVLTARDEKEFARQLRTVQYLQGKLKAIDEKIAKAETYVNGLRDKWNQKPNEPVVHDTVIIESDSMMYPHRRWRGYGSRPYVYEAVDYQYTVPIVTTPVAPVSIEEKEAYFKKKQDHIRALKARK